MKPCCRIRWAGLLLAMMLIAPRSEAVEIVRWERLPLTIPLVVGQERVIFIDRNMRIGTPSSMRGRLRVQTAGGALYLRASVPIPPTRLQLQDTITGEVMLFDVVAEAGTPDHPPLEPLRIVDGTAVKKPEESNDAPVAGEKPSRTDNDPLPAATPVPVVLTRYAAQSLYAPLRTIEPVNGVLRAVLGRERMLESLLPTLPVCAEVLAAWRLDNDWVTAVRLSNTSKRWIILDPRALQGDFVAATFQHAALGPAGGRSDATVVYLVTQGHGLTESLLPPLRSLKTTSPTPAAADAQQGSADEK